MTHYKVPKSLVFVDVLSKTGVSKVDKPRLIEQYGAGFAGVLIGRRLPDMPFGTTEVSAPPILTTYKEE